MQGRIKLNPNRLVKAIFKGNEILAEEFEIESRAFGSTTYKRKNLRRGFEPDSCFYFKNERRMRGKKRLNLAVDPPPELVVEIDISSSESEKASTLRRVWYFRGVAVQWAGNRKTEFDLNWWPGKLVSPFPGSLEYCYAPVPGWWSSRIYLDHNTRF